MKNFLPLSIILFIFRNSVYSKNKNVCASLLNPASERLNMDLIMELISYIVINKPPGAILVFLTGWGTIKLLSTLMEKSDKFPKGTYYVSIHIYEYNCH